MLPSALWVKGQGFSETTFPHGGRESDTYLRSPFYATHVTRRPLVLWVDETPDERFGVMPVLRAARMKHYICFPMFFANGDTNGISFATQSPGGFGRAQLAMLAFIMPVVANVMEIITTNRRLDDVLRIYIGDEPHKRVLAGEIVRGEVSVLRAAILFADMRDYTALTMQRGVQEVVDVLNRFFDCLVMPIEDEGGEVLKYMGDGLLAIFRDKSDDTGGAAAAALDAARRALALLAEANRLGAFPEPIRMGIALHHGEVAYGNVGSGLRLDFTVVGRDVNIASRAGECNRPLGEPLLVTRAFAEQLWQDFDPLGSFSLRGIPEPVALFRPRSTFMA
jgi:adenylate cyclase